MKKTNTFVPKFLISTLVLSFCMSAFSVYAFKKAETEDGEVFNKITSALRAHYKNDNIHFNIDRTFQDEVATTESFAGVINRIDVKTTSGEIQIYGSSDQQLKEVKVTTTNAKKVKQLLVSNHVLGLPNEESFGSADVTIEIPASFAGEIAAKSVSGDIKVLSSARVVLNSVSGDITLLQKNAADVIANSISGQIEVTIPPEKAGDFQFKLNSLSGEVTNVFKNESSGTRQVVVNSTSGDIHIQ